MCEKRDPICESLKGVTDERDLRKGFSETVQLPKKKKKKIRATATIRFANWVQEPFEDKIWGYPQVKLLQKK